MYINGSLELVINGNLSRKFSWLLIIRKTKGIFEFHFARNAIDVYHHLSQLVTEFDLIRCEGRSLFQQSNSVFSHDNVFDYISNYIDHLQYGKRTSGQSRTKVLALLLKHQNVVNKSLSQLDLVNQLIRQQLF